MGVEEIVIDLLDAEIGNDLKNNLFIRKFTLHSFNGSLVWFFFLIVDLLSFILFLQPGHIKTLKDVIGI